MSRDPATARNHTGVTQQKICFLTSLVFIQFLFSHNNVSLKYKFEVQQGRYLYHILTKYLGAKPMYIFLR